ncbi:PqqD family protein [Tellurirhabdus bombi]|uniref:PqqD family protein n=1 Tax=Tellurirhabdus bombi TaxID=2907205 RepID=UPI001F1B8CCD|nr:PqqD family protein [Tellurirhabdus bombi]
MVNYTINPNGIASEHFPDETIIINLPKGNYYSLRGTGQVIWNQLEQGAGTTQILEVLLNQYSTTDEVARPSLTAFLSTLSQEELVKETAFSPATATSDLSPVSFKGTFVAPALEVYTDMQELLMLDPIHEADPDKGWPYKSNA